MGILGNAGSLLRVTYWCDSTIFRFAFSVFSFACGNARLLRNQKLRART